MSLQDVQGAVSAQDLSDMLHRGAIARCPRGVKLVYEFDQLTHKPVEGYRLASNDACDLLEAAHQDLKPIKDRLAGGKVTAGAFSLTSGDLPDAVKKSSNE